MNLRWHLLRTWLHGRQCGSLRIKTSFRFQFNQIPLFIGQNSRLTGDMIHYRSHIGSSLKSPTLIIFPSGIFVLVWRWYSYGKTTKLDTSFHTSYSLAMSALSGSISMFYLIVWRGFILGYDKDARIHTHNGSLPWPDTNPESYGCKPRALYHSVILLSLQGCDTHNFLYPGQWRVSLNPSG